MSLAAPCRRAGAFVGGLLAGLCGAAILMPAAAAAQDVISREVVQQLPSGEVQRLNRALMQLARDPRDLAALLEAGEASLAVDDFDAATGFFARAAAVAPDHPRALVGLARVYVRADDAPRALDQFDKAAAVGVPADEIIAERALAFDLVGDQAAAQAGYRRALQLDPRDNETRRRLALSFAIAGNRAGFEDTLRPLLDQRDTAALRTRAFGLAVFGDQERAAAIVEQIMPRDLSSRLIPYLEFMPRLTKPQQAAAANLGIFPRSADIGRDDPRLARFAREAQADSRLQPSGAPLGSGAPAAGAAGAARGRTGAAPSRPGVVPSSTRSQRRLASRSPAPAPVISSPTPVSTPAPAPMPPAAVTATPVVMAPATASVANSGPPIAPALAAATVAPSVPAPQPEPIISAPPPPVPVLPPAPSPSLRVADAFADFDGALPDPQVGGDAVDITRIEVRREVAVKPEPKPEAKPAPKEPPKPVHPSRHWVQIATGRDVSALKFDWRRFERKGGDLFKGTGPHIVRWGQANRLLVGPVTSREKAATLVKQLKDIGIDSFTYASPEGEQIQLLQ